MRHLALLYIALHVFTSTSAHAADFPMPDRRELAKETFNYLYKHALCVESAEPAEFTFSLLWSEDEVPEAAPCDWVYDGAYQLHWAAKELYSIKPLKEIAYPRSEWKYGGYVQYLDPVAYAQHGWLLAKIYFLLTFGREGIPPRENYVGA